MAARVAAHVARIVLAVLLGALISATLMRFAPGFDVDEEQIDSQLNSESIQALKQSRAGERNLVHFYAAFLRDAAHGNFGVSHTLNRQVRELVAERLPVTAKLVGWGLLAGWILGVSFAVVASLARTALCDVFTTMVAGLFLCIPTAVLALLFVYATAPAFLAIALIVFAKVFRYMRNLLARTYKMPHIVTARVKGLGSMRILLWHVLPVCGSELFALGGISVSIALGAAIPVEALCSIPGMGQLAWQAALGRDLSLLVTVTVIVTLLTLAANSISDLAGQAIRPQQA